MAGTTAVLILCISAVAINVHMVESAHHTGAPAPAPVSYCSTALLNMADCVPYVTAGSTVKKPEGSCCSGLKTVMRTDGQCLFEALKNSVELGLSLNMTRAIALPSACNISSVSYCGSKLIYCLPYVTAGAVKKPEGTCCSGLKLALKTDGQCFCEALKNSAQLGLLLNMTTALALPSSCHINAPSASDCGIHLGTATAPVPAPMTVDEAPTKAGSNSSMAIPPTHASQNSGSSGLPMSIVLVFLSMLLSIYFYSY
ncbi:hypothetical protein L1987_78138 [Smallanthus sonchifolius]|uniref:Uncharacterized protein n=1 Tax=Smallanthus sonchifolius TaxID=185202 RepID=A0ACB8ZBU7_9ASTR|nr:hypothetical protein L1987_78138 [Smallanthus sonchifolius]